MGFLLAFFDSKDSTFVRVLYILNLFFLNLHLPKNCYNKNKKGAKSC